MEKNRIKNIYKIVKLIPRQCTFDIVTSLCLVSNEWKITLINGSLVFTGDEPFGFAIPLTTIYGTLRTSHALYLLCNNNVLHQFDWKTHQHWVAFLNDAAENIPAWTLN